MYARSRTPTAAIVGSQSLQAADTVGAEGRGWDGGEKVAGSKRHVAVDCLGPLLVVLVTAASVQDRDTAVSGSAHCTAGSPWCGP